nr:MAG: putative RNA-dependent RNA polymerase [Picobirnavirus sp.]
MPTNNVARFINNHFYEQNAQAAWTDAGFNRLRTYLGNASKGQPKVYTAPFAKGQDIQRVLKDWQKTLESIKSEWPTLWDFEIDLSKKVGPLSVQKPLMDRMPDIASYYEDILLSSKPVDARAIKAVQSEFASSRGLQLRSYAETVKKMKKSTNSGNPFFAKRRTVLPDTVPCTTWCYGGRHPGVEQELLIGDYSAAAVIGWRGQEGGPSEEDVKQRVVWMFPLAVNINELQVYQPLIEDFQRRNHIPAWVSMDEVDKRITNLFDSKSDDDLVVCTDFSRFDQHFNSDLQDAAKAILADILDGYTPALDWLSAVFPIKYVIPLAWEAYMKDDEPIVTYFEGYHGMASGSGGTNVDETLAHRALQYEAAILHGEQLNPNSQCLGDDGILSYPGITVDDVVKAYESHGQECNVSKQYASTQDCVYLRRWHHKDYRQDGICVGVYSTCRAIGRLRYLERFMDPEYWTPEMVALRQLSIIENCNRHPLKTQFAEFCMKRDKYRLGIDIPGFLDNIVDHAKKAIDHMPDFLGYTKTLQGWSPEGITDWWIVKYLKSVR